MPVRGRLAGAWGGAGTRRVVAVGVAAVCLVAVGCSSSSGAPRPSLSPSPSVAVTPKPGGTLRVVGTAGGVSLDPALARDDAARLVVRLVLRQLYSYDDAPRQSSSSPTPVGQQPQVKPDLADGQPDLSDDGRTVRIKLRSDARWDVSAARRVTAGDELRAIKRLCLPNVASPLRGFLSESVVGFDTACRQIAAQPPTTLAQLDAVSIPGLSAEGDTTLLIQLRQSAEDLTALLTDPSLSPLPVETMDQTNVVSDPSRFVGDGPYSFQETRPGETYFFSRSSNWSPTIDPLRHAYVDYVSVRGGMSAPDVLNTLGSGGAELSWDVALTPGQAPPGDTRVVSVPNRDLLLVGMGDNGPNASLLAQASVRRAIADCLGMARGQVADAYGGDRNDQAVATDRLLEDDDLVPPTSSPSAAPTPSSSGSTTSPTQTSSPGTGCGDELRTAGVPAGTRLVLLTPDDAAARAAAGALGAPFGTGGVTLTPMPLNPTDYARAAGAGGWDLALTTEQPAFPAPRAVLAPLLDPSWPASDTLTSLIRSGSWYGRMLDANAESDPTTAAKDWRDLETSILDDDSIVPLARLATVRPVGPNLADGPVLPWLGNADPDNSSLASTKTGVHSSSSSP